MSSEEYESDLDEFLDSLPAHLRTKALRKAYGEPEVQRTDEVDPEVRREPLSGRENVLWWLLLPFACAASLLLVGLAMLASAVLLLPVAAVLMVLAAIPIGRMATWRLRGSRNEPSTQ